MRTKKVDKPTVNIITLGCSKNLVDSENLSGQLKASEISVAHEYGEDTDVVVVNTCGFIDKAKEESVETILDQIQRKKEGRIQKLYVSGCLSERYKEDLQSEMPEVDAFYGTTEMPAILSALGADYRKDLIGERVLATPKHYAYMKISEGCNRTCAFCAIPLMRGGHVSRPIEELVAEAKKRADQGVKEIMLIAQELTYYGLDIYKKRKLPELLNALAEVDGIEWIRLHYAYPTKFPLEILDVIRENPKVCNYLDMPLQHVSDKLLKSMKRQISKAEMLELLEETRRRVPGIAIRSSFILGFPGETEEDVQELEDFLEEQRFERVGVFTYSHEENTAAYALEDDVPEEEKEARAQRIISFQQDISLENNENKIGEKMRVLVDRKEAGRYIARSEYDSVEVDNEVIIHTDEELQIGEFYEVLIEAAYDYDLEASLVFSEA